RGEFLMVVEMRTEPARHRDRPLHDIDPAGSGIEFGLQPCPPRIDRKQRVVDFDARFLLEGGRHLFHEDVVPRPVVAAIDKLFRLVRREGRHRQGGGRSRQQFSAFHPLTAHPFTAPWDRPATRWRWARKEKMITGRITSTPEAVMPPQSTPVSPPEN